MARKQIEISDAIGEILQEIKEFNKFPYHVSVLLALQQWVKRDQGFQAWKKKKTEKSTLESKASKPAPRPLKTSKQSARKRQ